MPPIDAEPSVVTSGGHLVGDLAAHQQRRDAGRDLHHRQRHDEGGDADHRQPERVDEAEQGAERQRQQDRGPARQRHVGDVDVGFLQREIGDRDAGDVGDAAIERSISAHRITKVRPTAMMPVTEIWVRMLPRLSSVAKEGLAAAKKPNRQISVRNGAMLRIWERSIAASPRGRLRSAATVTLSPARHAGLLTPLPAGGPC